MVAAAEVEVVAVPPCFAHETINAAPIRTVINVKTYFFIVTVGSRAAECSVARKIASNK